MFLGPTGVGKTHLAKKLSEFLFDSADTLIRIDMSEYMEKFSVSRLIGAPPGYVGYEEGGQLTERVRRRPYSVVLLDEIEKAHPDVFNLLLQVMDEGGVGFNTREVDREYSHSVLSKALNKAFSPEFLNRIDDVIIFETLDRDAIFKIIDIELAGFYRRIKGLGYSITISDEAKNFIASKGCDVQFGARPLKRGKAAEGDEIIVDFNPDDKKIEAVVIKADSQPKLDNPELSTI